MKVIQHIVVKVLFISTYMTRSMVIDWCSKCSCNGSCFILCFRYIYITMALHFSIFHVTEAMQRMLFRD